MPKDASHDVPRLLQALGLENRGPGVTDRDDDAGTEAARGADWLPNAVWVPQRPQSQPSSRHHSSLPPGRHERTDAPAMIVSAQWWREVNWRMSRRHLGALLVVLALSAATFVIRVSYARAAAQPVSLEQSSRPTGSGDASPAASGAASPAQSATRSPGSTSSTPSFGGMAAPTASPVTVHVIGRVSRPGVVTLPPGSRVADAIAAAGGATARANVSGLNLAQVLVDGQQVQVPGPGKSGSVVGGPAAGNTPARSSNGSGAGASINVNTASASELEELPGVGPVLASRIVAWREEHGAFKSVDDLANVSGIGEKLLAGFRSQVAL